MTSNVLALSKPREGSGSAGRGRGTRATEEVAVAVANVLGHGELEREQECMSLLLDLARRAISDAPLSDVLKAAAWTYVAAALAALLTFLYYLMLIAGRRD